MLTRAENPFPRSPVVTVITAITIAAAWTLLLNKAFTSGFELFFPESATKLLRHEKKVPTMPLTDEIIDEFILSQIGLIEQTLSHDRNINKPPLSETVKISSWFKEIHDISESTFTFDDLTVFWRFLIIPECSIPDDSYRLDYFGDSVSLLCWSSIRREGTAVQRRLASARS